MEQRQRLSAMGCGGKGKVALLMSQGEEGAVERDCSVLMDCIVRRVAAGQFTATPEGLYKNAEALCVGGECAAAAQQLQRAIGHGHLPSRALKAWILLRGREGVAQDCNGAFELVEEGASLGCHHCQGVMAACYWGGDGCEEDEARSLELARESSGKGSRYGQYVLGWLYYYGVGGVAQDNAQALALYRLAAAQNFDEAQLKLGNMYYFGDGVARDLAEALRLFQLAAAQGHPSALASVAACHQYGHGVPANNAEAIRWYRRARAAGDLLAAVVLRSLRA
jgi:TPR repeat protein